MLFASVKIVNTCDQYQIHVHVQYVYVTIARNLRIYSGIERRQNLRIVNQLVDVLFVCAMIVKLRKLQRIRAITVTVLFVFVMNVPI